MLKEVCSSLDCAAWEEGGTCVCIKRERFRIQKEYKNLTSQLAYAEKADEREQRVAENTAKIKERKESLIKLREARQLKNEELRKYLKEQQEKLGIPSRKTKFVVASAEIDIAIQWLQGFLKLQDIHLMMGWPNKGGGILYRIAIILREAYKRGKIYDNQSVESFECHNVSLIENMGNIQLQVVDAADRLMVMHLKHDEILSLADVCEQWKKHNNL